MDGRNGKGIREGNEIKGKKWREERGNKEKKKGKKCKGGKEIEYIKKKKKGKLQNRKK